MSATETHAPAAPPVEAIVSEVCASLALAAHAYLEPGEGGQIDLDAAEVAIDVAARAFERIEGRLKPEQRSAMASLLTDIRMAYVRKRGV